jgi:choline kinase
MKAIIIAAGRGSRLGDFTRDNPKCLLHIGAKTLLQHQIDVLKKVGVSKIIVVKGYLQEKINYPDIAYFYNDQFASNNILSSLMYAREELDDDVLVCYSDIIYKRSIMESVCSSKENISIVVDTSWKDSYVNRNMHPFTEAEKVVFNNTCDLVLIGKHIPAAQANGEFIGVTKFSRKGAKEFSQYYGNLHAKFSGVPFQQAKIFEMAYLTDIFQDLVDGGSKIKCVKVQSGWREIDTAEDYENCPKSGWDE